MESKFTIGVFGIILNEHKQVLLCHRRDYDLWNLPGGGLKDGESPWDGAKREIKEETGLKVEIIKLLGVYSKSEKNEIVFSFMCKTISDKISISDEADKIKFFAINKLPHNTLPKQVERINDAIKNPNSITFKIQTGKSTIELVKEGKL